MRSCSSTNPKYHLAPVALADHGELPPTVLGAELPRARRPITALSTLAICTKRMGYRYAGGAAANPPEAELAIGCKSRLVSNRRRLGNRNGLLSSSEYIGDSLMASTIGIVFQPTANILHVSVAPATTSQPSLTSDHLQRLFGHADSPPRPAASISSHPPVLRQPPANQVYAFLAASPDTARKVGLDLQEAADTNFACLYPLARPRHQAYERIAQPASCHQPSVHGFIFC
ncbi:hypothetical protein CSIM01_13029 [Colletotrichum simmondsii]|uniref:Uncharacterized protein n=1 Tax=Colletotrichum simmondsii TaxID=703756 RepID=A0A135TKK9_9PEZI|nr:hypothetical protein CSIM01_13029 [Colletotrichum simmondsii]